jgi:hypothetical protein
MSRKDEKTEGYQGWTNYETWAVNLWIGNEQESYSHWQEAAKMQKRVAAKSPQVKDNVWTAEEAAKFNLADQLKAEIEEDAPDLGSSLYSDLLSAAMSEVNWTEIAQGLLEALD